MSDIYNPIASLFSYIASFKPVTTYRYWLRRWIYHRTLGPFIGPILSLTLFALYAWIAYLLLIWLNVHHILPFAEEFRTSKNVYLPILKEALRGNWEFFIGTTLIYVFSFEFGLLRYPKGSRTTIPLGVAFSFDFIETSDLPEAIKYKKRIIRELENLLAEKNFSNKFQIIVYNDFHANRIHDQYAKSSKFRLKLLHKSRVPFVIFGFTKKDFYTSKQSYKFDLNYIVGHRDVPLKVSSDLSREFTRALKNQKWIFPVDNIGSMTEIVARNIEQSAFFALGVSAIASGAPYVGRDFLLDLKNQDIQDPTIESRLNRYLSQAYYQISRLEFMVKSDLPSAIKALNNAIALKDDNFDYYLLAGYFHFLNGKDIQKAFSAIALAEKYQGHNGNSSWKFSKAFLHFYSGQRADINEGLKILKGIKTDQLKKIPLQTYDSIVGSILDVISAEGKTQYYYNLIFAYAKGLRDYDTAREFLTLFKQKVVADQEFKYLSDEAEKLS